MVTADGDLYQCISEAVAWWDPGRDSMLGPSGFMKKKGLAPEAWARAKALMGCHSDNVKGISGIGEITAVKYLTGLPIPDKKRIAIECAEGQTIFQRNLSLVELPHAKTRPFLVDPPRYCPEAFFKWCKKLGMNSYLDGRGRREWENLFAGNMNPEGTIPRKRGERRRATNDFKRKRSMK